MNTVDPDVFVPVNDLLCRFFHCFDRRDWPAMTECLMPEVTVDYASSGREPPSTMPGEAFVRRRREAVDTLTKQHGFSNLRVTREGDGHAAIASCHYLILRFELSRELAAEEENFFHSCGSYEFQLRQVRGEWKIAGIKQQALQSWGNSSLHAGSAQGQKSQGKE
ncbi:nuclear transport factor 2 family protein [Halomonas organivorans]|uniref:SnoaL-like domain-containing protein n=1 Tax=Halomonas organivorans TaxID=257772 RepID=A0A7W5G3Y0_9GAMM|nr:hypothetical protein [Halomonas organivorans]